MTTKLTRPVRRDVGPIPRARAGLIVTLRPEGIEFREKRRQRAYLLPYSIAFGQAAWLFVAARKKTRGVP